MDKYNCQPPPFKERIFQKTKPELQDQDLRKCLSLFDLVIQGLAHIVGGGIFVITPGVVAMIAGPSLVFSYMISAVVLLFTVVCYMDLGSRYRGIGNAYVYVYASLGELGAAFVWVFLLIEMSLAQALIGLGFGQNVDLFLLNGTASKFESRLFYNFLPLWIAENINIVTIGMLIVCCVINCVGIKQVTWVNTGVVTYSVFVLCCYFVIALVYGDFETFSESKDPVSGREGIFPFGFKGLIRGSAIVIVSFCGFETIVTLSAEAKNPKRDVPVATIISYVIAASLYIMTAFSIAYLVPWYAVSKTTGIPNTLKYHKLAIPMYFAIAAVLFATFSVCLCQLTTLARSLFMVATDGLFFKAFTEVAECSQVPVLSTITITIFCIFLTFIFSYDQLIHLVSGGALLAFAIINYTIVVISYTSPVVDEETSLVGTSAEDSEEDDGKLPLGQDWKVAILMALFTKVVVTACLFMHWPGSWSFWTIRLPIVITLLLLSLAVLVYIRVTYTVQKIKSQTFVCPFVPFFPGVGLFLNLALFSSLDATAHYMTLVYIAAGLVVYVGYGYFHSELTVQKQKDFEALDVDMDEVSEEGSERERSGL